MRVKLAGLLLAALAFATPVQAAGLSGMGAAIYGNTFSFRKANLQKAPVDKITVGKLTVGLQTTKMKDIQKAFGGTIQSTSEATWLCYHSADTNTWFISNAFGGQEFVMMVAVEVNSKMPEDCEEPNAKFAAPVFDVPGVGASLADLKAHFGAANGSKIAYRSDRPGGYTDIAQYLGYMLKGGKVIAIGVGETSIPTTH
ncbi:MAG: hypothetical protein ABIY37_06825 [Devosia sp.]